MKIGIIAAMSSEREQLLSLMSHVTHEQQGIFTMSIGQMGDNTLYVMECGIGKVNAAVGATNLILGVQPDVIISTGVAGGIDAQVDVMQVVASNEIVYHDVWCGMGNAYGQIQGLPERFQANSSLLQVALSVSGETKVHAGLICSGDKFITDRTELDEIKKNFPQGMAVDMESGAIAQVCHLYNVPFISFRIISDTPGADNHWQQYENFWGEMANRSFFVVRDFLNSLPSTL